MSSRMPWHGVVVATALPFRDDLSVDLDAYAENLRGLIEAGCDGVCPNGSLGEYQTLTDAERAAVVRTAVETVGGDRVLAGIAAYGSMESRRWAEQAAEAGAGAVMLLPPNAYRADERSVLAHYQAVAEVGIPIVAYNNPIDTKVDLVPELLQRLHEAGYIRAVKEFSGDTRRAYRIKELAPDLDLLIGADDVLLELALAGAVGCRSALIGVDVGVTTDCRTVGGAVLNAHPGQARRCRIRRRQVRRGLLGCRPRHAGVGRGLVRRCQRRVVGRRRGSRVDGRGFGEVGRRSGRRRGGGSGRDLAQRLDGSGSLLLDLLGRRRFGDVAHARRLDTRRLPDQLLLRVHGRGIGRLRARSLRISRRAPSREQPGHRPVPRRPLQAQHHRGREPPRRRRTRRREHCLADVRPRRERRLRRLGPRRHRAGTRRVRRRPGILLRSPRHPHGATVPATQQPVIGEYPACHRRCEPARPPGTSLIA